MVDLIEQCNMLYQKLEADWDITAYGWNDSVRDSFQQRYVRRFKENLIVYLQGYYGGVYVRGKGFVDLVRFIDECGRKLSALTGEPFNAGNPQKYGNDYISLGEPMLHANGVMKSEYRDQNEESILTQDSDEITRKRQHSISYFNNQ